MKRLLLVLLLLNFIAACQRDDVPKGILSRDQMTDVLTDIHIIDGYLESLPSDSVNKSAPGLYHSVFTKYKIDSAGFARNLKYYTENKPQTFGLIYDSVKKRIDNLQLHENKIIDLENKKAGEVLKKKAKADSIKKALSDKAKSDSIKLKKKNDLSRQRSR